MHGVSGGREGLIAGLTLFSAGDKGIHAACLEDSALLRKKTLVVLGAEVYRKATGDRGLG
jgi:hypothetical protein